MRWVNTNGALTYLGNSCYVLTDAPKEAVRNYRRLIGSLTKDDARRLWGDAVLLATAEHKGPIIVSLQRTGDKNYRPTRITGLVRIELTLRTSGRLLSRVRYTFPGGRAIQHGWRDMGALENFCGDAILAVEGGWRCLGWNVTQKIKSPQLQAQVVMGMFKRMG